MREYSDCLMENGQDLFSIYSLPSQRQNMLQMQETGGWFSTRILSVQATPM